MRARGAECGYTTHSVRHHASFQVIRILADTPLTAQVEQQAELVIPLVMDGHGATCDGALAVCISLQARRALSVL